MRKIPLANPDFVKALGNAGIKDFRKVKESKVLKEFKEFALRGNMIDLAIGILIGGGFNKIVTSLVNDIIMPPIGLIIGKVDFSDLFLDLSRSGATSLVDAQAKGAATLNYGLFLNNILDFLIIAIVVFFVVKQINRWKRSEQGPPPEPTNKECPFCVSMISVRATRCPNCTSELAKA